MRIEVYRGDGTRRGDDVEVPILETTAALIERGRVEMDRNAHQKKEADLEIVPRSNVRTGQLVSTDDSTSEGKVVGKVTGISITVSGGQITHRINVERPE